jgi:hypothetical protein
MLLPHLFLTSLLLISFDLALLFKLALLNSMSFVCPGLSNCRLLSCYFVSLPLFNDFRLTLSSLIFNVMSLVDLGNVNL